MFCKNCGEKLDEGTRFCTKCGTQQEAAATAPSQNDGSRANAQQGIAPQQQPTTIPRIKMLSKRNVIIAGAVVVVALVAWLVIYIVLNTTSYIPLMNSGRAYFNNGDYDNAIKQYNKLVNRYPNQSSPYALRADAYGMQGNFDAAIKDFTEAIRHSPNYVFAYVGRGMAYWELGQLDRAIQDFEKALSIDPNDNDARQALQAIRGY